MSKTAATIAASVAAAGLGWLSATGRLTGQLDLTNLAALLLGVVLLVSICLLLLGPAQGQPSGERSSSDPDPDQKPEPSEPLVITPMVAPVVPDQVAQVPATETAALVTSESVAAMEPVPAEPLAAAPVAQTTAPEVTAEATATPEAPAAEEIKADVPDSGPTDADTAGTATAEPEPAVAGAATEAKALEHHALFDPTLTLDEFKRKVAEAQRGTISDLVADGTLSSEGPITDRDVATLTFLAVTTNELVAQFADGSFVSPEMTPTDSIETAARIQLVG